MNRARRDGFSLLELVAVVAILAILATALTPALLRNISAVIYRREASDLLACANAMRASIQTHRVIPGTNEWASSVSAQMGVSATSLTTNVRNNSRVFIVDPTFNLGPAPLPYTNASGLTNPPISPRMILVSSIGPALPTLHQSDFNNLWLNNVGSVPAGAPWTGWGGHGDELVIQRINLSDLFAHLVLLNYPQNQSSSFSIDSTTLIPMVTTTNIYVIKGTVLGLVDNYGNKMEQIITRDCTFAYSNGAWRSSISDLPVDPSLVNLGILQGFLSSELNQNASTTQSNVVLSITSFLDAYSTASANGFRGVDRNNVKTAQDLMMATIAGLLNNPVEGQCQ